MATADRLDQTNRFLDVLETADRTAIAEMLDDQVIWSSPMSFSGNAEDAGPAQGRDAFGSHLSSISGLMRSADSTTMRRSGGTSRRISR